MDIFSIHHFSMYHGKSLLFQKTELFLMLVVKIRSFSLFLRMDQAKQRNLHPSFLRHLRIQLTNGTGAKISGVFVFGALLRKLFIDSFKIGVGNKGLPPNHKMTLKRNLQRQVLEGLGIFRNQLSHDTVSSGYRLYKLSLLIMQNDG